MKSLSKTVVKRGVGRPLGVKNKPKAIPHSEFKRIVDKVFAQESPDLLELQSEELAKLRHQIVGFRAVISYLENRLGLDSSQ